jgi:hypothetical protein
MQGYVNITTGEAHFNGVDVDRLDRVGVDRLDRVDVLTGWMS